MCSGGDNTWEHELDSASHSAPWRAIDTPQIYYFCSIFITSHSTCYESPVFVSTPLKVELYLSNTYAKSERIDVRQLVSILPPGGLKCNDNERIDDDAGSIDDGRKK